MSQFTVQSLTATLTHYDQLVREAIRRGDILQVMDTQYGSLVRIHILFLLLTD